MSQQYPWWRPVRLFLAAAAAAAALVAVLGQNAGSPLLLLALGVVAVGVALMVPALRSVDPGMARVWLLIAGAALVAGASTVRGPLSAWGLTSVPSWVTCLAAGALVVLSVLIWTERSEKARPTRNF